MGLGLLKGFVMEAGMALIGRIAWKTVAERWFTRQVIKGLRKLQDYDSNDLYSEEVDIIIGDLQGKRLKVADG